MTLEYFIQTTRSRYGYSLVSYPLSFWNQRLVDKVISQSTVAHNKCSYSEPLQFCLWIWDRRQKNRNSLNYLERDQILRRHRFQKNPFSSVQMSTGNNVYKNILLWRRFWKDAMSVACARLSEGRDVRENKTRGICERGRGTLSLPTPARFFSFCITFYRTTTLHCYLWAGTGHVVGGRFHRIRLNNRPLK